MERLGAFESLARVRRHRSRCLKAQVCALIVDETGVLGEGLNDTELKQGQCLRVGLRSGQGYELCKQCGQANHAEIAALLAASKLDRSLKGCTMYIAGHDHMCPDCGWAVKQAGIHKIIFVRSRHIGAY